MAIMDLMRDMYEDGDPTMKVRWRQRFLKSTTLLTVRGMVYLFTENHSRGLDEEPTKPRDAQLGFRNGTMTPLFTVANTLFVHRK